MALSVEAIAKAFSAERGTPVPNYARRAVDTTFSAELKIRNPTVLFGATKQGKTALRLRHLSSAEKGANGRTAVVVQCTSDTDDDALRRELFYAATGQVDRAAPATLTELTDALQAAQLRIVVLENYQRVLPANRSKIVDHVQALEEYIKFVFIGSWLRADTDQSAVSMENRNVHGTLTMVQADEWGVQDLMNVMEEGAKLLGVQFDQEFTKHVVRHCGGSVIVVQRLCIDALKIEAAKEPLGERQKYVCRGVDVVECLARLPATWPPSYQHDLKSLASGFPNIANREPYCLYGWLLARIIVGRTVTAAPMPYPYRLSSSDAWAFLVEHHPEAKRLSKALIDSAFAKLIEIQDRRGIELLDFDGDKSELTVIDREFVLWCNQWLANNAQLRNALIDELINTGHRSSPKRYEL